MSRYIDADALPRHGQRGGLVHWKDIKEAPSIDIVRCKECIFAKERTMTDDLIRRSDVIEALKPIAELLSLGLQSDIASALMSIPTIEPKRGKWIYQFRDSENTEYRCSKCGYPEAYKPNYCPNCGSDNREE